MQKLTTTFVNGQIGKDVQVLGGLERKKERKKKKSRERERERERKR